MTIFKMLNHDLKQKDSVHIHGSNNWVYTEWNGKNFFFFLILDHFNYSSLLPTDQRNSFLLVNF